jgi:hypothetical protein
MHLCTESQQRNAFLKQETGYAYDSTMYPLIFTVSGNRLIGSLQFEWRKRRRKQQKEVSERNKHVN